LSGSACCCFFCCRRDVYYRSVCPFPSVLSQDFPLSLPDLSPRCPVF
jgi:hypothetical protein